MIGRLAARLGQAAATFLAAVVLLFVLMRLTPGDPIARLAEEGTVTVEETRAMRARYGLDRPMGAQLADWMRGAVRGDFGRSIQYDRTVRELLAERLPASLLLGGTVLLVDFTLGAWLGAWQARRRGLADRALSTVALVLWAIPGFWLGLLLAALVAIRWRLLPAAGMHDPLLDATGLARAADALRHLVLPALTLVLVTIAAPMQLQRDAMREALARPFVLAVRARGVGERAVARHAWRNALFPLVTLFGLYLPFVVTGSVFVEAVFAWPGLGLLAAQAAGARDYPLLMGTATLATLLVVAGGLVTDAAYLALDPRTRRR